MLDAIGTIVLMTVVVIDIYAFTDAMPITGALRLAIAGLAGAWTGLATAIATAGMFANAGLLPPPIGIFVALPPVAVAVAALFFPAVRAALLGIPLTTLVGLNIARAVGVFFVLLAWSGRLDGPFPQSAGWGDVITGVVAAAVLPLVARRSASSERALWAWNAFGALDLFAAVTLGVLSANGSPLQLIHAGAGSAAVQSLPWVLIPTVLVPFYLITHGVIFAQLAARKADSAFRSTRATASMA
jgi:hypothetical protein